MTPSSRKPLSELDPHLRMQFDDNWFAAAGWGNAALLSSFWNEYEFDIDYPGPKSTSALMEAAFAGELGTVQWLLLEGADPDRESAQGGGALAYATVGGDSRVVAALLDAGADIDKLDSKRGITALTQACIRGHMDCIDLLLKRGADPWFCGDEGPAPLEYAAGAGSLEVVDRLISARDSSWPNDWCERAAWHAASGGQLALLQRFIEHGADPTYREPRSGMNGLHRAAWFGHPAVIEFLLEAGLPIDGLSHSKWTPLLLAAKYQQGEAALLLLERGADPGIAEPEPFGVTPLMHAAIHGDIGLVRELLAHGADPSVRDGQHGLTAKEWAEGYEHPEVAELLSGHQT